MIDILYYLSENSFVDYKINYEKLRYLLRKIWTDRLGQFISIVMNNKAFNNLFCNPLKSFHTSAWSSDSNKVAVNNF